MIALQGFGRHRREVHILPLGTRDRGKEKAPTEVRASFTEALGRCEPQVSVGHAGSGRGSRRAVERVSGVLAGGLASLRVRAPFCTRGGKSGTCDCERRRARGRGDSGRNGAFS